MRLAERWGADPHLARRAGILHDCTKYLELDEQLALCEKYHVPLDELERVAVKLLHAKTGACIARAVFGEPDAVYQAIFWHTTAKADMTTLEKILYVADYMEPNRDFEGVERLRELAYRDLDKALLLGVETTIQEMKDRNLPIHKNTLQAQVWLQEQYDAVEDCEIIVVRVLKTPEKTLDNKKQLKAVIRWGAGYDSVDIEAAGKRGISSRTRPVSTRTRLRSSRSAS